MMNERDTIHHSTFPVHPSQYYPLTLPADKPSVKYFSSARNKTKIGTDMIVEAAITTCGRGDGSFQMVLILMGMVNKS